MLDITCLLQKRGVEHMRTLITIVPIVLAMALVACGEEDCDTADTSVECEEGTTTSATSTATTTSTGTTTGTTGATETGTTETGTTETGTTTATTGTGTTGTGTTGS